MCSLKIPYVDSKAGCAALPGQPLNHFKRHHARKNASLVNRQQLVKHELFYCGVRQAHVCFAVALYVAWVGGCQKFSPRLWIIEAATRLFVSCAPFFMAITTALLL